MTVTVGLDIGGTKLMVAAADASGAILRRTREATPLDLDEGLDLLNRMIAEVAAGDEIAAIGAAIGGPLDAERGIVSPLHQPQWRAVPRQCLGRAPLRGVRLTDSIEHPCHSSSIDERCTVHCIAPCIA